MGETGGERQVPPPQSPKPKAQSPLVAASPHPTLVMHTFPLPFERWRHFFTEGAHVVVPWVRHVPPECIDPQMKCRSRMHWWLAMQEAARIDPKAVPLCLNLDGHVTETPGAKFPLL